MPFCPKCKAEHQEGFKTCSDCDVELVDELPSGKRDVYANDELVPVFSVGNRMEADIVIGILEGVGIRAWFQAGGVWRPGTEIASPVDYGAILVLESQANEARSIIQEALAAGTGTETPEES